ncbi:MAG: hypothetical protein ACREOU_15825 [Candidatus Eiseniibacteriota bacterium]
MKHPLAILAALAALSLPGLLSTPAHAVVHAGDVAPAFTKDELDAPPPAARSLSDYAGKVVVLFLMGYN